MISILGFLARLSIIVAFGGMIFSSISDLILKTTYLQELDNFINLGDSRVEILLGLLSIAYLLIFMLSWIKQWTKYSQNRKIKGKNGEIEVAVKTINEVSKEFLLNQEIIKNTKVKSQPKGKNYVIIEAVVDTYNVEKLSEKLTEIQEELSRYVENSTGIQVKKVKIKIKKILAETIVEKKVLKDSIKIEKNIEDLKEEVKEGNNDTKTS